MKRALCAIAEAPRQSLAANKLPVLRREPVEQLVRFGGCQRHTYFALRQTYQRLDPSTRPLPMTQKLSKIIRATKAKTRKGSGSSKRSASAVEGKTKKFANRGVRGPEDPCGWCRNRFWWSTVLAHRCTPEHAADRARYFLVGFAPELAEDAAITARAALDRIDRDGTDPSTNRGEFRGVSFLRVIGSMPGYAHTMAVFDSPIWSLLKAVPMSPDTLVEMQDALVWEVVLGVRYRREQENDLSGAQVQVHDGRLHGKAAVLPLRLGSLAWRTLTPVQFAEAVELLAMRPSWPGLSLLCVLYLRMAECDARPEVAAVRGAIIRCVRALGLKSCVDPRAAALLEHLVRRRVLGGRRLLDHPSPVLEWARGQLQDLAELCRNDSDCRWLARQVDALASAIGNADAPVIEWLGWTDDLGEVEAAAAPVMQAIDSDPIAGRMRAADDVPVRRRAKRRSSNATAARVARRTPTGKPQI